MCDVPRNKWSHVQVQMQKNGFKGVQLLLETEFYTYRWIQWNRQFKVLDSGYNVVKTLNTKTVSHENCNF